MAEYEMTRKVFGHVDLKSNYSWAFCFGIIWWVLLNPGFYSVDSLDLLRRIESRQLTSEWTLIWELCVFLISIGGSYPSLVTLFFALTLNLSIAYLVRSIVSKEKSLVISLLMFNCPAISFFGITLWHDVPMTAGLVFLSGSWIRFSKSTSLNSTLQWFASLLVMFRHNGVWTAISLCLLGLVTFRKQIRKFAKYFVIPIISLGLSTMFINANTFQSENVQVTGLTSWMKYDIACWLSNEQNQVERLRAAERLEVIDLESLKSKDSCYWFLLPDQVQHWSTMDQSKILNTWLFILKHEPMKIIEIHSQRNAYLLPNPINLPVRPPFLHTNIEFANPYVAPTFPGIYENVRSLGRVWNYLGPLTGYAGIWLLILFMVQWHIREFRVIFFIALILNSTIFISAIIPDVRFVMYTIISGYIGLILTIGKMRELYLSR